MQPYFQSKIIKKFEAQKLFKFRTNMEDFSQNFKNGNENIVCKLCNDESKLDSQNHFLKCKIINELIPESINANIMDIYSKNENIKKQIIVILMKAMTKRIELLPKKKR